MADFVIAMIAVIGFLVVFMPVGILLYRYGFWLYDKIDNWFEKHGKGRGSG